MSSKNKTVKGSDNTPAADTAAVATEKPAAEAKAPAAPRSRGPRGTEESAVIKLVATANPKRPNSKAFAAFSNYKDGMTIKEFADLVGKEATGHLVYDAKHGFITIAGYDPGAIIVPKERAPAKPKAEKKVKVAKDTAAEAETANETMD